MKPLILLLLIFLAPKIGFAKPYTADIYYPEGDGPFPVIILSHGAGGPSVVYKKKAEGMARNGRAAVVLDHYSARGDYGAKFRNIPKETLMITIQHHHKYFSTFHKKGNNTNEFLVVTPKHDKIGLIKLVNERVV